MTRVGRRWESADIPEYNYILMATPAFSNKLSYGVYVLSENANFGQKRECPGSKRLIPNKNIS